MSWALSIPLGGTTPKDYLDLLVRLLPDGYSTDADGPRMTELEAYAHALWIGGRALARASAQSQPALATELLEEWERVYALPNDAARTLEERQARLVADERATAGASRSRVEAALSRVAPLMQLAVNARTHIAAAAAADELIFRVAVELSPDELASPATRKAVARVLRRLLPARLHSTPGFRRPGDVSLPPDFERHLAAEGASWAKTGAALGVSALSRQDATTYSVREPAARLREYAGLVRLDAADLNDLQEYALSRFCAGAGVVDAYASADTDLLQVAFAHTAAAGSQVQVDASTNWRDRYILTSLRYSTDDIRPGQSGDVDMGVSSEAVGLWSSLDGGSGIPSGDFWTFATDLHLYADVGGGALWFSNQSLDPVTIVGTCIASPDLGLRS